MEGNMIEDLFDIIKPNVETEACKDDFVYSIYVEWPEPEELEDEVLLNLLEYFGIEDEYDIESEKDDIIKELKELGVPTQTTYEHGYEMPEEQKFWREEEYDWEYYANNPVDKNRYDREIDKIREVLLNGKSQEVKAMYLFKAFVLTENFQKAVVYSKLPNTESCIFNEKLLEYVEINLKKQLNTSKGRFTLYKFFTGSKLGEIPYLEIRNLLAHELDMVWVDNVVIYEIDNVTKSVKVDVLMSALKEYCSKIADTL